MRIHDADGVQRPQSRRPNDTGHHALGRAFDYSITGLVVAEGEVGGESFTRSGGVPV